MEDRVSDASTESEPADALTREELQLLRSTLREALASYPAAQTRRNYDSDAPLDREAWQNAADLDWLTLWADEESPGIHALAIAAEEIGRVVFDQPVLAANVAARALARRGSPDSRDRYLQGLEAGKVVVLPDLASISHRAEDVQAEAEILPSGFRIRGPGVIVERGADADIVLVSARMPAGDISQFLLPVDVPGVRRGPLQGLDLGRRYAALAIDVEVGGEAVLERASDDADLNLGTVVACAESLGAAERAFESTLSYLRERTTFGRAVASYQVVKHRLTDMRLWIETSRAIVEAAVDELARGDSEHPTVSVAKAYVSEKLPLVARDCLHLHGGIGFTWEHDIHLYMRRIEANSLLCGSVNDHLYRVADAVVSPPAELA